MKKNAILLIIGLLALISCNKSVSPEFYVIQGEFKDFEGKIYLSTAVDTLYYSNNFKRDSATVVDGKFEFKINPKFKTPLPFHIYSHNGRSPVFFLQPKDDKVVVSYVDGRLIATCKKSLITDEQEILYSRMKSSGEELAVAMNKIYNSNYSNDSIQKYSEIAQSKFKKNSLSTIKEFSEEYPKSFVSFWYLAMSQMFYGYEAVLESSYENLSPEIKNSDVAKLFEEKLLMSKVSQTGSPFPTN